MTSTPETKGEQQPPLFDPERRYTVVNPAILEALPDEEIRPQSQGMVLQQPGLDQLTPQAFDEGINLNSLERLREWYVAARELKKNPDYLERITTVAQDFKMGKMLSQEALKAMQQDIQAFGLIKKRNQQ